MCPFENVMNRGQKNNRDGVVAKKLIQILV